MGNILSSSTTIPYLDAELTNNRRNNYIAIGNLSSKVDISRQLSYVSTFGFEVYFQNNMSTGRPNPAHIPAVNPSVVEYYYQVLDLGFHWQNFLNYHQVFAEDHEIDGSIGFDYGQNENQWIPTEQRSLNSSQFSAYPSSGGALYHELRSSTGFRNYAVQGSLNYILKGRYILNGAIRREVVGFDSIPGIEKAVLRYLPFRFSRMDFLKQDSHFAKGCVAVR